jgi:hypothetical protein
MIAACGIAKTAACGEANDDPSTWRAERESAPPAVLFSLDLTWT